MTIVYDAILYQYGALPFSITETGEIRVLLVTTRGRGGWIIPKGWPIRKLTAAASAAREAYEEAGLIGYYRRRWAGGILPLREAEDLAQGDDMRGVGVPVCS